MRLLSSAAAGGCWRREQLTVCVSIPALRVEASRTPGAVPVCLARANVRPCAFRRDTRVVLLSRGTAGWHFRRWRGGGRGRRSVPRDVIGHGEVARARGRPNLEKGDALAVKASTRRARPAFTLSVRITSDGDRTDPSGQFAVHVHEGVYGASPHHLTIIITVETKRKQKEKLLF